MGGVFKVYDDLLYIYVHSVTTSKMFLLPKFYKGRHHEAAIYFLNYPPPVLA